MKTQTKKIVLVFISLCFSAALYLVFPFGNVSHVAEVTHDSKENLSLLGNARQTAFNLTDLHLQLERGCPDRLLGLAGDWYGRHGNQILVASHLITLAHRLNRTAILRPFHQTGVQQMNWHKNDPLSSPIHVEQVYSLTKLRRGGYCIVTTAFESTNMNATLSLEEVKLALGRGVLMPQRNLDLVSARDVFWHRQFEHGHHDFQPAKGHRVGVEALLRIQPHLSQIGAQVLTKLGVDLSKPFVAIHHRFLEGYCIEWAIAFAVDQRTCYINPIYAKSVILTFFPELTWHDVNEFQYVISTDGQHKRSLSKWRKTRKAFLLTDSAVTSFLPQDLRLHPVEIVAISIGIFTNATYFLPNVFSTMSHLAQAIRSHNKRPVINSLRRTEGRYVTEHFGQHFVAFDPHLEM